MGCLQGLACAAEQHLLVPGWEGCRNLLSTEHALLTHRTRMGAKEQPEKASKIKLLCLHGYTQNKDIFSQRIGSMR